MKKISTIFAILGLIGALWIGYTTLHFGATNMHRVEAQAYAWKLEHHGP